MKLITLITLSALLFISSQATAKEISAEKLDKEIIKLTKERKKQETKILDLMSESKVHLAKSQILKDEGDLLIELGKKGQMESLSKYTSFVSKMGKAQNSKVLKQELKYLKELQSSWEVYDKKIETGEQSIEKSVKLNIKGIKANDEASKMMQKVDKTKTKLDGLIEQKNSTSNTDNLEIE